MASLKGILGGYIQKSKDFADKLTDKALSYISSPVYSINEKDAYEIKAPFLAEDIADTLGYHCNRSINDEKNAGKMNALQEVYNSVKGTNISPEEIKALEASALISAENKFQKKYAGFESNFAALKKELIDNGYNDSEILEDVISCQKPQRTTFFEAIGSITMAGGGLDDLTGKNIVTDGGGNVNQERNHLINVNDPFYWILNIARKNKKTVGVGMAALAIGAAGYAVDYTYKNNKNFADSVDNAAAKANSMFGINAPTIVASEIAIQMLAETASTAPGSTSTNTPANGSVKKKQNNSLGANEQPVSAGDASVTKVNGTPNSHVFTSKMEVYGSDAFKTKVYDSLEDLKKTPDRFLINGMTAYDYATYYLDELYEGDKENYIDIGKEQYPITLISPANLIHISRHIEQGSNRTLLANMEKWRHKGESGGLFNEHDAVKLQVAWEKVRYNLTDEQTRNSFIIKIKYYTDDPKYLGRISAALNPV